jgi:membrane-bound serine protease (ClpP class)
MRIWYVRAWLGLIAAGFVGLLAGTTAGIRAQPPPAAPPLVLAAVVDGIIHPVAAEHIVRTIDRADEVGAELTVLTLRTPGGLVDTTRLINSRIIAARSPVAFFVAPGGARAASAGFYIMLASDIAAMAPGTHIGAAHPVTAGAPEGEDDTMAKKAASDLAAYARSLAAQRQRNVELAEEAVLESRSFTEQEALSASPPLIDLIAADLGTLLAELDGREVRRWDGSTVTLRTAGALVEEIEMTWRQRLLSGIAHPQVAYILLSLGVLGLTIELWNPGGILPGVAGALCLLLAFFALQILPVNYAGLLLMILGLVLLTLEVFVSSFGVLAVGGVISLLFGSLILFDSPMPELQLGLGFVLPVTLALSAIMFFLVNLAVQAHRRVSVTGPTGMLNEVGRALTPIEPGVTGRVATRGEIWTAVSTEPIPEGERVRVTDVNGLTLTVRRDAPGGAPGGEQ